MLILGYLSLALCFLLTIGQTVVAVAFLVSLSRHRRRPVDPSSLPKAAVIMSMRGPDPFLESTLQRLLQQDYPNFDIHLVVDSLEDPAWHEVQRVLREHPADNVFVTTLKQHRRTCSLKCAALIEAVGKIQPDCSVVAFLDGDAMPHPHWLSDLIKPLCDTRVGASTGNRWFVPAPHSFGSVVRYLWNVGAIIQMWLNRVTWGGSMAMRVDVIHSIGLLDAWSRSLPDDTAVFQRMREHGLKVRFVPGVILVNREDISVTTFARWLNRQMIFAKTCGLRWCTVPLHAWFLAATQVLALSLLALGLVTADPFLAGTGGLGITAYWGSSMAIAIVAEWILRRVLARNAETIRWTDPLTYLWLFPAMVFTQFLYPVVLAFTCWQRSVRWRGIRYELLRGQRIVMCDYRPYPVDAPAVDPASRRSVL